MKTKKKQLTNKEISSNQDIIMMEIQKISHAIDTVFLTLSHYIAMNGDSDKIKKFIIKENKKAKNV